MKFKTELGNYIYRYCELPKLKINDDVNKGIAESFCARNNIKFVKLETVAPELHLVTVSGEENLQMYANWRFAYEEHGYSPPLLEFA